MPAAKASLYVDPLTPSIGAVVSGIDLAAPASDDIVTGTIGSPQASIEVGVLEGCRDRREVCAFGNVETVDCGNGSFGVIAVACTGVCIPLSAGPKCT